jgi:ornithine decarboxylase
MAPSVIALTEQSLPAELPNQKPLKGARANGAISVIKHDCTASDLLAETLKKRIESIDHETCEPGEEDAFFVADVGEVYRQHLRWKLNLKRVKPFYGKPTLLHKVAIPLWERQPV